MPAGLPEREGAEATGARRRRSILLGKHVARLMVRGFRTGGGFRRYGFREGTIRGKRKPKPVEKSAVSVGSICYNGAALARPFDRALFFPPRKTAQPARRVVGRLYDHPTAHTKRVTKRANHRPGMPQGKSGLPPLSGLAHRWPLSTTCTGGLCSGLSRCQSSPRTIGSTALGVAGRVGRWYCSSAARAWRSSGMAGRRWRVPIRFAMPLLCGPMVWKRFACC